MWSIRFFIDRCVTNFGTTQFISVHVCQNGHLRHKETAEMKVSPNWEKSSQFLIISLIRSQLNKYVWAHLWEVDLMNDSIRSIWVTSIARDFLEMENYDGWQEMAKQRDIRGNWQDSGVQSNTKPSEVSTALEMLKCFFDDFFCFRTFD